MDVSEFINKIILNSVFEDNRWLKIQSPTKEEEEQIFSMYRKIRTSINKAYGVSFPIHNKDIKISGFRTYKGHLQWFPTSGKYSDKIAEKKELISEYARILYVNIILILLIAKRIEIKETKTGEGRVYSILTEDKLWDIVEEKEAKKAFRTLTIDAPSMQAKTPEELSDYYSVFLVACFLRLFWKEDLLKNVKDKFYPKAMSKDLEWIGYFLDEDYQGTEEETTQLTDVHNSANTLVTSTINPVFMMEKDIEELYKPGFFPSWSGKTLECGCLYYFYGYNCIDTLLNSYKNNGLMDQKLIYLNFNRSLHNSNDLIENIIRQIYELDIEDFFRNHENKLLLILCECQNAVRDRFGFCNNVSELFEKYRNQICIAITSRYWDELFCEINGVRSFQLRIEEAKIRNIISISAPKLLLLFKEKPELIKYYKSAPDFSSKQSEDHFTILDNYYRRGINSTRLQIIGALLNERSEPAKNAYDAFDSISNTPISRLMRKYRIEIADLIEFIQNNGFVDKEGKWNLSPLVEAYLYSLDICRRLKSDHETIKELLTPLKEELSSHNITDRKMVDNSLEKATLVLQCLKHENINLDGLPEEEKKLFVGILFDTAAIYDDLRQMSFIEEFKQDLSSHLNEILTDPEGIKIRSGYGYSLLHLNKYFNGSKEEIQEERIKHAEKSCSIQKECEKLFDNLSEEKKDNRLRAFIKSNQGAVELYYADNIDDEKRSFHLQQAIKCHIEAEKYRQPFFEKNSQEDDLRYARSLANIGTCYYKLQEYAKAVKYQKRAMEIREKYRNSSTDIIESWIRYTGAYMRAYKDFGEDTDSKNGTSFTIEKAVEYFEGAYSMISKYGFVGESRALYSIFLYFIGWFDKDLLYRRGKKVVNDQRISDLAKKIDQLYFDLNNTEGNCYSKYCEIRIP